jgi:tRNA-dihydrouridine synthase
VPLSKNKKKQKEIQFGLAPMEGVTCLATRLWFSVTSQPDFAMTPFLRVTRDYPWKRVASTYAAEIFDLKGATNYRVIPQLMGTSPLDIERIAIPLLKASNFVDINCGCPSPKVVGSQAGSGLLEKCEVFDSFLNGLQERIGASQFSIKMRSGFTNHDEFPSLLNIVSKVKMSQLTLHARTRKERYTGLSKWNLIDMASTSCPFPVVGSGDIVHAQSLDTLLSQAPHVNKVIIGRGALRNPWIFNELRNHETVTLSTQTLLLSLACFAILQDQLARNPMKLFSLVARGLFLQLCGTNQILWEKLYSDLTTACYGHFIPTSELLVDRASFARVKMLWNSMRSSLGNEFMNPTLLRVSCFPDFEKGFLNITQQSKQLLHLNYYPQFDWIYSGEKNNGNKTNR